MAVGGGAAMKNEWSLRNKYFWFAIVALAFLPVSIGRAQAQRNPDSHSFLLRLPASVDTTGLNISYYITGAFGGFGGYVRTKPNVRDYLIEASYENRPAQTLKIIIYCPGYGIKLIDVSSLADSSSRSAAVELEPLPSVSLTGKIVAPEGRNRRNFKMEVEYLAFWVQEVFGIADGMVASFKVASADVKHDGVFSIAVPDFARDPAIASFKEKGALTLRARDPKTGNAAYTLESADRPGRVAKLGVAAKYDGLLLQAKPVQVSQ